MRASGLLALLFAATAAAHEAPFDAAWIQPLAPAVIRGAILPLGYTHGLGRWADFSLEMTPYWAKGGVCFGNGCRDQVFGMIATAGVAFGQPIATAPDVELEWFVGPKLIAAVASETGTPGAPNSELRFIPGTSWELGAGMDIGLQVHGRRFGWFAALVVGLQYTKAFNYGVSAGGPPNPPSWPFRMMSSPTTTFRSDDWYFLAVPNLNLFRVGFVF